MNIRMREQIRVITMMWYRGYWPDEYESNELYEQGKRWWWRLWSKVE